MYQFKLVIGDWSGDGHSRSESYLVRSNYPVEQVREAHFLIKEKTGIDIERICSEYQDSDIDKNVITKLLSLGFQFEYDDVESPTQNDILFGAKEMAKLWVFLLQKADPNLSLEIIDFDIPTLHFWGVDKLSRHIGFVGYGLFC